jgi:hypothetical protein
MISMEGFALPASVPVADVGNQGTKRALLIGINKYKALPTLQGSINDIETMREILLTRWAFPERNITVMKDEAATRAGMLAALEQFVRDAGPNDIVYFHYSGHGSQVEDLNGDESDDHLDETLVPQDGRTAEVRDITDDELDTIFARLRSKTAFIVLDSCHSGTATRSLDFRTRSIPRDPRVEIYRKAEAALPKTRAIVPVLSSRYVLMTGAASHQEALDGPVEGRYHGFFTFALSRSLSTSSPHASPREVLGGVERELKRIQTRFGRSSMPEPQLEAPPELLEKPLLESGLVAASTPATRLAWIETRPVDSSHVTLVNGPSLGASLGSVWSLYPAGETHFAPGRALAVATVIHIAGKEAKARLQSTSVKIQTGARAVLLLPAPTGDRIPIRLLDMPQDHRKSIEDTIRNNLKDAELVGPETVARFLIGLEGQSMRLLTADGLQTLATFRLGEPWGSGLATILSRSANAAELLTLDNPSSQLRIDARVANVPPSPLPVVTRGIAVVAADTQPAQYRIRRSDEPRSQQNTLQLEVRVSADSYVTIVDVDSEGGVNLLFPNASQRAGFYADGFIRANETVLIPDSLRPGNRAGFYWDYSPPKGTDTIRVFASTDVQTAQMIREQVRGLQSASAQTRGRLSTQVVSSTVRKLRDSLSARGIVQVYDPTSHVPSQIASSLPGQIGGTSPSPWAVQGRLESQTPTDYPEAHPLSGASSSAQPGSAVTVDWTATSVSVSISD